jgi:hypothetical protein
MFSITINNNILCHDSSFYIKQAFTTARIANQAVGKSPFSSSNPYLSQQPVLDFAFSFSRGFAFLFLKLIIPYAGKNFNKEGKKIMKKMS